MNNHEECDEVIIETLENEPEWENALRKLHGYEREGLGWKYVGKSDANLISEMLIHKRPIPEIVLYTIGTMLSPHDGWVGGRIRVDFPKTRHAEEQYEKIKLHWEINTRAKKAKLEGEKYDNVVDDLVADYGMSKSSIKEIIARTDKDFVEWSSNAFGLKRK